MREIKRSQRSNELGNALLDRLEASPRKQAWREALWRVRAYLVVTPGPELIRLALEGFPREVRELCATAPFHRFAARGGGGFYPDRNEIWLAAGVETYEGRTQVPLSSRHELFHFVCWNHPRYRDDESTGFPRFRAAIEKGHAELDTYPRYRDWYRRSFLPQGDHANIVELFADIPTNFRDLREIPPALAEHFEPLIGS
ncbi:MAG: hypothetical protein HY071_03265 [Chloroflexi bacterium]|nr:hypothetical protein [Chloroflexota bacterium]